MTVAHAATPAERFWPKVEKTSGCWIWKSAHVPAGYGTFYVGNYVRMYAHRWSYEQTFGVIPEGLELDHLCRNRACVRPDHLEPVTHAENHFRRRGFKTGPYDVGSHCRRGHERTPANTGVNTYGYRFCRPCARAVMARLRREKTVKA